MVLAEEIVLARECDRSLPVLDQIRVNLVSSVSQVSAQAVIVLKRIVYGFPDRTLREDLRGFVHEPCLEALKYLGGKSQAKFFSLVKG